MERTGINGVARRRLATRELTRIALFVVLIAAGAFIKIPLPTAPFTLQFLFTTLAGLVLGGRNGAVSVGVYIALGLMGLPVFAEGGGVWYVAKPSFGYLIGFAAASYATGRLVEKLRRVTFAGVLLCNICGLLIVYGAGLAYTYAICNAVLGAPIGFWPLFLYGVIWAAPGDICLCAFAAVLLRRLRPLLAEGREVNG